MKIRASIIGANGYTGLELINILLSHPFVELKSLVSVSNANTPICNIYPSLIPLKDRIFDPLNIDEIAKTSDVIFSCLPHGSSANLCIEFFKRNLSVIDLSADFRYTNIDLYESTYKLVHPSREIAKSAVYGLPEIYKNEISNTKLVANPGCYTTCSIIPIYPLLKENVVSSEDIIIDAKSGTSGAGKKNVTNMLFSEVNENFKAYSVTTHRHTSEIEEQLSKANKNDVSLSFTPHLLPITRGILSTIYLKPNKKVSENDLSTIYKEYFFDQPFVCIDENEIPSINSVKYSNYIRIGLVLDKRINRLIVISCLDNLIKGASGQAVQNMNIMFNLDETISLLNLPKHL